MAEMSTDVNGASELAGGKAIALALSGGGSRAIAFHLGCLRGLKNAGLLQDVSVISSVSGGSVLAALYCSTPGDFTDFEKKVRRVLRQGFIWPACYHALFSFEGLRALLVTLALRIDRALAFICRLILLPLPRSWKQWSWLQYSSIRRSASRTTILSGVFDKFFQGKKLSQLRQDRPRLIIVACELRARAAIYFTKDVIQCWRYGKADPQKTSLAHAVAASAAYPLLLPAIDSELTFQREGHEDLTHRVILTDGGVYDNMGLAPFWPDRDTSISMPVEPFRNVIACRAGYPLSINQPSTFAGRRMADVFDSVFMRAQNAATQRLFNTAKSGKFEKVLMPYLGQKDSQLGKPHPDLTPLSAVKDYPTDFSSMTDADAEALIRRGETLVLSLLEEHWGMELQ